MASSSGNGVNAMPATGWSWTRLRSITLSMPPVTRIPLPDALTAASIPSTS